MAAAFLQEAWIIAAPVDDHVPAGVRKLKETDVVVSWSGNVRPCRGRSPAGAHCCARNKCCETDRCTLRSCPPISWKGCTEFAPCIVLRSADIFFPPGTLFMCAQQWRRRCWRTGTLEPPEQYALLPIEKTRTISACLPDCPARRTAAARRDRQKSRRARSGMREIAASGSASCAAGGIRFDPRAATAANPSPGRWCGPGV